MPSQAVGFAEILAGGILVTAGIGSSTGSVRDVLAGKVKGAAPFATSSSAASASSPAGAGPEPAVSGKGTANPLPGGWQRSRTDQGVDFVGGSKIYAPESGKVIKTGAPGWPEGGGVLLHTISGKIIYFYEGLAATVKAGQMVNAGQEIATAIPGGSIEVGFADAAGVPLSHSEYSEGVVTRWGKKAATWLSLIGAPR